MGIAIPQVITPSKASGAQVIDGSLRFDSGKIQYLTKTFSSAGNRDVWTWSSWVKRGNNDDHLAIFSAHTATNNAGYGLIYLVQDSSGANFNFNNWDGGSNAASTNAKLRDNNGWYHLVVRHDESASPKAKLYINGQLQTLSSNLSTSTGINNNIEHRIGHEVYNDRKPFDGAMSQCYFIDGQALGPEEFGFTDPLTNTWKPKKYTGTFGTNGFWLPMDGNSPIGKDQSGNGNDWTPQGFGGSVALDNPIVSGARPTLNTLPGGTLPAVGYFGSRENKTITVTVSSKTGGGNAYFFDGVERDSLEFIHGTTILFDTTDSSNDSHPFKLSSTNADSSGGTEYTDGVAYFVNGGQKNGTDYVNQYSSHSSGFRGIKWTVPHNVSTTYYYCTVHTGMGEDGRLTSTTDETKADKFAWKCFFALPCVGQTFDLSSIINLTSGGKALTVSGASASSEETHFYNRSIYFDGGDDNIKTESTSHFLSPAEYTIEGWINITSSPGNNQGEAIFDTGSGGSDPELNVMNNSGTLQLYESLSNNTNWDGSALQTGRWYHFAQVVQGSSATDSSAVHKIYIDGQLSLTNTINLSGRSASSIACIGSRTNDSVYGNFYLSDLRFYQIAKYTSNFVVPSPSPDILPDTPSGVSGGSKLAKIQSTGGSVAFSGGSGGSDIKWTGTVSATHTLDYYIFASGGQSAGAGPVFLSDGTDGYQFDFSTGTDDLIRAEKAGGGSDTGYQRLNKGWNHIRLVQQTTSAAMYINGKPAGTFSPAGGVIGSATFYIGTKARLASSVWFRGFICNVRIIEAALSGFDTPVINDNGVIASSEGGTSAIFLWPGVNSLTENTGTDGDTITATADPVLTRFNPFTYTDINIVRGQETGYNTFNPLLNRGNNTLSDGNTFVTGGSNWNTTLCTGVIESGKWFVELTHKGRQSASDNDIQFGLFGLNDPEDAYPLASTKDLAAQSTGYVIVDAQAQWYNNSSSTSYGNTWSTPGDVVGLRYNADTGKLGFIINGVDQGDISSTLSTSQRWVVGISLRGGGAKAEINFGQKPFKFPPPDGFLPLNAANVRPEIVISRPDQYVGVSTGNFDTQKTFVTGFQPDLVWFKSRSNTDAHILQDSVRGVNSYLISSSQNGAGTFPVGGQYGLTSFNYNGWTHAGYGAVANSAQVAWSWKAGGNKNTFNVDDVGYASAAAAGLDGGSITPTGASVGTKQGFSIIKFTNTTSDSTQSHGLTQKPDFIIWKKTSGSSHWAVYHSGIGATKYTYLNLTNAAATGSEFWNNTEPTSSLVTTRAEPHSFGSAGDTIMYLWHDVPGLQKFGTYTSTAVSDGPYVELGFRPAVVWCKNTGTNANNTITGWSIYFNKQNSTERNSNVSPLFANANGAGGTRGDGSESGHTLSSIDFLSNGFKIRSTSAEVNTNTGADVYVYCAWAEAPSIDLYGGGANAR